MNVVVFVMIIISLSLFIDVFMPARSRTIQRESCAPGYLRPLYTLAFIIVFIDVCRFQTFLTPPSSKTQSICSWKGYFRVAYAKLSDCFVILSSLHFLHTYTIDTTQSAEPALFHRHSISLLLLSWWSLWVYTRKSPILSVLILFSRSSMHTLLSFPCSNVGVRTAYTTYCPFWLRWRLAYVAFHIGTVETCMAINWNK